MRMWMVDPKMMCRQHLLGEHNEIHKLRGHMLRKKSITGWVNSNCMEISWMFSRHDELLEEMKSRGYSHSSPLEPFEIDEMYKHDMKVRVDVKASRYTLICRCNECAMRYYQLIK